MRVLNTPLCIYLLFFMTNGSFYYKFTIYILYKIKKNPRKHCAVLRENDAICYY